jgi:hypothetical protein
MLLHLLEIALLVVLVSINVAILDDLLETIERRHRQDRARLWLGED